MWQEIIIWVIAAVIIVVIAWKVVIWVKRPPQNPCDNCEGCELKEEFTRSKNTSRNRQNTQKSTSK